MKLQMCVIFALLLILLLLPVCNNVVISFALKQSGEIDDELCFIYGTTIFLHGEKMYLWETEAKKYAPQEVLVKVDNRLIMFGERYNFEENEQGVLEWTIWQLDLESLQMHELYRGPFFENNTEGFYRCNWSNDYSERNAFYYEGKIVLNDLEKVVEYDLETGEEKYYLYEEYNFPTIESDIQIIDSQTLCIDGELYSVSELVQDKRIARVLKIGTERFGGVVYCNEDVFITGYIYDWLRIPHAVLFRINSEIPSIEYIGSPSVYDRSRFYVITEL